MRLYFLYAIQYNIYRGIKYGKNENIIENYINNKMYNSYKIPYILLYYLFLNNFFIYSLVCYNFFI